ncbi:MAG: twin-arginine translocase subunit TatC, partial [Gemmataceae bacterium]
VFGLVAALALSLYFTPHAFHFITAPIEGALQTFHRQQVTELEKRLNDGDPHLEAINQPLPIRISMDAAEVGQLTGQPVLASADPRIEVSAWLEEPLRALCKLHPALMHFTGQAALKTFGPAEGLLAYFKIWLYCGILLASPWIFYQLWLFVAEGLYPHEKKVFWRGLPFSLGLFLAGVALCQFVVVPQALDALLFFNRWLNLDPDIRFGEWLTFAVMMPLVFGLTFQLPIVMLFLQKVGIAGPADWARHWRIALFVIEAAAAVLSPTMDALCMQFLALPLFALYWLGIGLCYWAGPTIDPDAEPLLGAET